MSESLSPLQKAAIALKEMRARLDAVERSRTEPIAIVGMSGRFPGAADCEAFWQLLYQGVDAVAEIPAERWSLTRYFDPNPNAPGKMNARCGGFIDPVDQFDPGFFGISAREAVKMDPQQRLLLELAWEALENAGHPPRSLAGTRTGTYIGINQVDYGLRQVSAEDQLDIYTTTGNGFCFAAGRISYTLGLQGPNLAVDTACSSSLVAVHLACQGLRSGECELAIAGGVQLNLIPTFHLMLAKTQSLSPSGRCRTFDAAADGLILGEGGGVVVLKRLSEAIAHRDRILALVRGSGINHGGPSSGITVPSELAQETLIRQVLKRAEVAPAEVKYVETHGTGTSLGDPVEVGALASVFRDRPREDPLVLGAVKTNIGHLDAAAGIAGLIKVVLALQHQQIPPNLHFTAPNPHIDWDACPFQVPTEPLAWPRGEKPRLAGVSSFGISGTNAHILLGEAPEVARAERPVERGHHLFTLSAPNPKALEQLRQAHAAGLDPSAGTALADICFTASAGRSHFSHRFAALVDSVPSLQAKLMAPGPNGDGQVWRGAAPERGKEPVRVAFLFSGETAGLAGSGGSLYRSRADFRRTIERCSAVLDGHFDQPLSTFFAEGASPPGPAAEAYLQAALFALEYALAELWQSWGVRPAAVTGQGVGEYVAACVAGVFSLADGLRLAVRRAASGAADFDQAVGQVEARQPRVSMAAGLTGEIFPPQAPPPAAYWRQARAGQSGTAGIGTLTARGHRYFLAIGPHWADAEQGVGSGGERVYLPSLERDREAWQTLLRSLARLYVDGLEIDWEAVDGGYAHQRQALPTYPFQRQRYWLEEEDLHRPAPAVVDAEVPAGPAAPRGPIVGSTAEPAEAPQRVGRVGLLAGSRRAPASGERTGEVLPILPRVMAQQLEVASAAVTQVIAQQLEFLRGRLPAAARGATVSESLGEGPVSARASAPLAATRGAVQEGTAAAAPVAGPAAVVERAASAEGLPVEPQDRSPDQGQKAENGDGASRDGWQLLLISAPSEAELEDQTRLLVEQLEGAPGRLAAIARAWQQRAPADHCRVLVCQDAADACAALAGPDPRRVATRFRAAVRRPVAFLFPGVGDHYPGMAREFYQQEPVFREQLDYCCEQVRPHLGRDLREILYPAAQEEARPAGFDFRRMLNRAPADENSRLLSQTVFNQPAVFIVEYALARLWMSWGILPQALLGYSVGEYVAACLAGVMSLEDGLLLLTRRAQLIQEQPAGAMLAVPLPEEELGPLLEDGLSIAILSTPSQCVVGGPPEAVAGLARRLKEREVLCRSLPTTHAFHSRMMEPLREPLTRLAGAIRLNPPQIPFLSNVTGTWISPAQATDPHYWAQHTYQTVRFAEGIGELLQTPHRVFLEIGPGQNLGSFVFQHPQFKEAQDCLVLPSLRNGYDRQSDRAFLLNTLGKLWLGGMDLDWARILG